MRMARRLGLLGGGGLLKILTPKSWKFKYENKEYDWTTNVQSSSSSLYGARSPSIDANGNHVFKTPGEGNYVVVAHSTTTIDISKYSKVRVKYEKWLNAGTTWVTGAYYNACIVLMDQNNYNYVPNRQADIYFDHPNDENPGEVVFTIPEAAKQSNPIRRLWVMVIRQSTGARDGNVVISSITFEK